MLTSASIPASGPTLLVHGGAWDIPNDALNAHRDGLRRALAVGQKALQSGARAVDVVTAVVAALEAHGAFDAGRGAMLNQDGEAELDAGVMDGTTLDYGAVMAVRRIAHPIRVARRLLDAGRGQVRMLAAEGAERFARAEGFEAIDNDALVCDRERKRHAALKAEAERFHPSRSFLPGAVGEGSREKTPGGQGGHDTVGCVARDADGHVAAATSTGGTPFKPPGRVGDSPLPGAGYYATEDAAAGATGWGEAIAAMALTYRTVDAVARGASAEEAARTGLVEMQSRIQDPDGHGAAGGLIVLPARGPGAWAFTTPRMARAGWAQETGAWVDVETQQAENDAM